MPSINTQILWDKEDTQAVAKTQDVNDGEFIVINGTLAKPVNVFSFNDYGWIRVVSITSSDDLTGINFHVRGYHNGLLTEDIIAGPNAATVYGAVAYDTIIEIEVTDGNATNVSIGSGNKGFFNIQNLNIDEDVLTTFVIQMILYQTGTTFTYSVYFCADKTAPGNTIPLADLINIGAYINTIDPGFINKTVSGLFFGLPPLLVSSILFEVPMVTDPNSTAKLIFMQL